MAIDRQWAMAITSFGVLLLLACFVYGRILELNPFGFGNVRVLFWADGASAWDLPFGDSASYPEWRPLAYLTLWLPYRWFHVDYLHAHHVINLLLWTGCAWLVWKIVYRLTHTSAPALLAAAVVVTDQRAVVLVTVLEHANSMACFFGLIALLIDISARDQRLSRLRWIGLSLLLLASGLSKEYGLAFTGAVAVSSLLERRRDVATAAIAAGTMYALLRITFSGGASSGLCRGSAYFFTARDVCFDGVHPAVVTQAAYNVVATAVGSILPGVFAFEGQIGIAPRRVVTSGVWLAAAALGWWKGPTPTRVTLLVVAFNAALSFMLYGERNQVVALCAVGIAAGVGLAVANAAVLTSARLRPVRATGVAVLLVLLAAHAINTRNLISFEVADSRLLDPCDTLRSDPPIDPAFVKQIKTAYAMPNPDCTPGR